MVPDGLYVSANPQSMSLQLQSVDLSSPPLSTFPPFTSICKKCCALSGRIPYFNNLINELFVDANNAQYSVSA